ncbi:MAG: bifunctional UDP-N-acetylglucosamine diphosphorylase/glucosamine-1-phosphate N-acetyltransferase GlmU [Caldicoprobacter oshimai]|uniref:Bifunctional protein GlmU n=1 Tax=Caldicoprobacter faecalis TaxID=937334 RepID=A0A1I5XCF6_9FIRM|nr:bifunctional UDP-N-acetylglucosamine diphosphorylase/glucosamine-1-phosphate N-acetyltransferase GlmU [Caldicoprobacter faecalis]PZN11228.1 MAG: bifunctional UDP-N-acetylglucosamine diphosphorylase/glucosamine-1-phosphate N-acetyltransferase GlmU [Caldicoprobacter oshimai]SFQ29337.1 UDP-N-acetylglucosamine pyrophosphorylase /glucosamine-1-phosphate N-acetyltransferase [Caldicoprobacter faecalis]
MEKRTFSIVLAAGEGTRMKSKRPKVLHQVCGYPIIEYVVRAASEVSDDLPVVVVGHRAEEVKQYLGERVRYAYQAQQLGTGHAVMMAQPLLKEVEGYVVVLAGDAPLIRGCTLQRMVQHAVQGGYGAVVLSAVVDDPTGYGRIVRNDDGDLERIVEHRDATEEQRQIKEINSSIYCFDAQLLFSSLERLNNRNSQGEYYLTDVIEIMKCQGIKVGVLVAQDADEVLGINTRAQLAEVDRKMRLRINRSHMDRGVTIIDPEHTYIGPDVVIGFDTVVYPGNVLEGSTIIGEDCVLYPNNRIVNSVIGNGVQLQASVVLDSRIGDKTTVGPYAYLRPGSVIGNSVRIGDFVEIKNSTIGDGTKISHLTYVGDAEVGNDVNLGCGVVFVNYDGVKKHRTVVEDKAFIGCNVNLVAPVRVGQEAYIAAGSTITEDVPGKALAIARERQVNKEGWVERWRQKTQDMQSRS